MSARIEMTGMTFGSWFVVEYAGRRTWMCRCNCGRTANVDGKSLRRGHSISCRPCSSTFRPAARTHGARQTRLYNIWCGMKRRCLNETDAAYPRYGGRGIVICDDWLTFKPFSDWALANGYADNLTIDRRDNDKGYSPENCRWATYREQNRNYSRVRYVEFKGERVAVIDLAERFGIKPYTLRQRLFRRGWSVEKAIAFRVIRANIDNQEARA